jgi:hypothetical protein
MRDDIIGGWRNLNNEELPLPNTIRVIKSKRMIWTGHVVRMGGKRIFVGRSTSTWEDAIKIILREIEWGGMG